MSDTLEHTGTDLSLTIKELIGHLIGIDEHEISTADSFENNLGVDSLDVIEIIAAVEKKFQITIPDEDAEKLLTVESLIKYVRQQKHHKKN